MSKVVLENLNKDKNYEITVIAFNSQGYGPSSRPEKVYVGEAVPTGAPQRIEARAISPTEVRISWLPPSTDLQNGDLLGYKIFYRPKNVPENKEDIEVVSATHNSHSLIFLDMYTNYTINILAFNPAGEGPRSESVHVRTLQGLPGPPANLTFSEITMTTLKVSWQMPEKPNGEILGYVVAYNTTKQDESKSVLFSSVATLFLCVCPCVRTVPLTSSIYLYYIAKMF